jgi:hypothetical protein
MDEATAASKRAMGTGDGQNKAPVGEGPKRDHKKHFWSELSIYAKDKVMLRWLIGASVAWFLLDIAYYGNTLSSPLVVKAINPHASLIQNTEITLAIFAIAAFPGYLVAAGAMDRMGRKPIQALGFLMMAIAFAAIAFLPGGSQAVVPFVFLYGLLLRRVRAEHDHVRVPGGNLPGARAHDEPRNHSDVRKARRILRDVRLPDDHVEVRTLRRDGHRGSRGHHRHAHHVGVASGTQRQESRRHLA